MIAMADATRRWRAILGGSMAALAFGAMIVPVSAAGADAADATITVASTTSTEQSGLFGHLLPQFERASGIKVRVVALGTGQALDVARRGDADVVFVHDPAAEEKFVISCWSARRATPPPSPEATSCRHCGGSRR